MMYQELFHFVHEWPLMDPVSCNIQVENILKYFKLLSQQYFILHLFFYNALECLFYFFYFSLARQFLSDVFSVKVNKYFVQLYLYLSEGLLNIISMLLDMHTDYTTRKISPGFQVMSFRICLSYYRDQMFRFTHIISKGKHPKITIHI